ncbi:hypothetical protein K3H43_10505 [Aeromonas veronii]|uniref:hypothetical protein n=1 Tax=Aeromonas veronii TaxID=654 RepID=UPI001F380169|nr:hypothetical protein [Aeromonas veronii]MCF5727811.1 hypothetical protein [Aeromonas veronii]
MKFQDIHFGSIDAKHDIEGRTPDEVKYFEDTFILPPNINIDDYLSSKKILCYWVERDGKDSSFEIYTNKG